MAALFTSCVLWLRDKNVIFSIKKRGNHRREVSVLRVLGQPLAELLHHDPVPLHGVMGECERTILGSTQNEVRDSLALVPFWYKKNLSILERLSGILNQ